MNLFNKEQELQKLKTAILNSADIIDKRLQQKEILDSKQIVIKKTYESKMSDFEEIKKQKEKKLQDILVLKQRITSLGGDQFVKLSKERDNLTEDVWAKEAFIIELRGLSNFGT